MGVFGGDGHGGRKTNNLWPGLTIPAGPEVRDHIIHGHCPPVNSTLKRVGTGSECIGFGPRLLSVVQYIRTRSAANHRRINRSLRLCGPARAVRGSLNSIRTFQTFLMIFIRVAIKPDTYNNNNNNNNDFNNNLETTKSSSAMSVRVSDSYIIIIIIIIEI